MAINARPQFIIEAALKGTQWERAKGELRALVAIQGSYTSPLPEYMKTEPATWEVLSKKVEKFIKDVEDNGLEE